MKDYDNVADAIKDMNISTLAVFLNAWQSEDKKTIKQIEKMLAKDHYESENMKI